MNKIIYKLSHTLVFNNRFNNVKNTYNILREQNVLYKVYHDRSKHKIINSVEFVNLLLPVLLP